MSAALALVEPTRAESADELLEAYLALDLWSGAARRTTRSALRSFVRHLGDRPVASIDRDVVHAWVAQRQAEGVSEHTAYNYLKIVRRWVAWLAAQGAVPVDPWARPARPPKPPRRRAAVSTGPLQRLADRYIAERVRRGEWSPATARSSKYQLGAFCRLFGDRPVEMLGRAFVGQWLDTIGTMAPASRRTTFGTVRRFCLWLVAEGHLQRDPFHGHRRPKVPRRLPRGLAHDDVALLFAAAGGDRRMRFVLSLMVQEGLRVHEVAKLELGDLDLGDRLVRVVGKGGHERVLPLTAATVSELRGYLAAEPMRGAGVIVRSRGDGWHGGRRGEVSITSVHLGHLVSELMRAAGVKLAAWDRVASHSLRHTAATDMLRRGAHVRDVQAVLGHADLSSTQVYLPLVVNDLRDVMEGRRYDDAAE